MFWVISLAYGIAVIGDCFGFSFRNYLVSGKVCQKGSPPPRLAGHAYLVWMEEVNRPRRAPGSYLFIVRAVGRWSNRASAVSTALHDHRGPRGDCLVGLGRTPRWTNSSTETSEILNSPASSARPR